MKISRRFHACFFHAKIRDDFEYNCALALARDGGANDRLLEERSSMRSLGRGPKLIAVLLWIGCSGIRALPLHRDTHFDETVNEGVLADARWPGEHDDEGGRRRRRGSGAAARGATRIADRVWP